MADDLGEKSEEPTAKRRTQARDKGNVAKSSDLGSALMLLVGTLTLAVAAVWLLERATIALTRMLGDGSMGNPVDQQDLIADISWLAGHAAATLAPILAIVWVAALLSQFIQVGWLFTLVPLQPSLSKLNPITGFQRIFGYTALVKAGIDILKVVVMITVVVLTVGSWGDRIAILPYLFVWDGITAIANMMLDLALRLLAALLIIGMIDLSYQKWKHTKDLKMTKQEVKDEMKQAEGDPQVKKRRMRMQQQIAMQRINAAVPQADVIVTNPEHISIAIKYDEGTMNAPRVIAKGADHLAMRIRQIANQHGIPIVERKPLARALYRDVEVGQEIPHDLYSAVAEVLAYVYRLAA